jgi:hypothetical protein
MKGSLINMMKKLWRIHHDLQHLDSIQVEMIFQNITQKQRTLFLKTCYILSVWIQKIVNSVNNFLFKNIAVKVNDYSLTQISKLI